VYFNPKTLKTSWAPKWSVAQIFYSLWKLIAASFNPKAELEQQEEIWELSIWDPSIFSLHFFCLFSPAQTLILFAMDQTNLFFNLLLVLVLSLQLFTLFRLFNNLIQDKKIHFEQVFHEYNIKFVNRRLYQGPSTPNRPYSFDPLRSPAMARTPRGEFMSPGQFARMAIDRSYGTPSKKA
jgi:hypothetical protein